MDRRAEKQAKTVSNLCDQYLAEGVATKKSSTIATDKGRIERHIKPLLGQKRVKDVTSNDVRRFMKAIADGKTAVDEKTGFRGRARVVGGKGTATRTVGLLGGIFSFAVAEGIRPDNPARGVQRFPDQKGKRYLSSDELKRLGEALSQAEAAGENPQAIIGLRLLILTGCRKSEILSLRWSEVDIEASCLRLNDSKTGEKAVPIGAAALEVLANTDRLEGNPYVIFGSKKGHHFVGLPKFWNRIRDKAGLGDVRLHDLRHSFASVGAGAGMGLQIVGALLGHRDPKTTARYAHIADSPAKVAADRISESIASAMNGGGADIIEFGGQGGKAS
jgi:integrase